MNSTAPVSVPQAAHKAEHGGQSLHANKRNQQDFLRAQRHSRTVALLKKSLPVIAVTIVVSFTFSALISYSPSLDGVSGEIGFEGGKLVMKEPQMAGFDKNDRAFDVKAFKAIQDLTTPGTVELEKIEAKLPVGVNAFADVDADAGTYDSENQKLNLRENVTVRGANGMNIALQEADIDIKTGVMVSEKPVSVLSDDADISADSVKVSENGKRIIFKNRVKMTIKRTTRNTAETTTSDQTSAD